ncbi:unnamed protein product [Chrysoparadoxa australica]
MGLAFNIATLVGVGTSAAGGDALFNSIQQMHADKGKTWGRFLDAGTGTHSLRWISTLETTSWTAVTADSKFSENMIKELGRSYQPRPEDKVIIGNWQDDTFLAGEKFDTILADYLIGAVDGFAPYYQDLMFDRLKEHLAPGGRLYVVGMEPVPFSAQGPASIVCEVTRLRDSCILLAGHRPYREYPVQWIKRQITRSGLVIDAIKEWPIMHTQRTIERQTAVARRKLPYFQDRDLAEAMAR